MLSDSLAEYSATAGPLLRGHAGRNTILLGAAATLQARGLTAFGADSPLFGWWQQPGTSVVSAAFLHTPPYPAALTSMPAGTAAALAQALARRDRALDGVNADQPVATAFATAWHELTSDAVEESMRSRLYQLGRLQPPDPFPAGQARVAGPADRDLLIDWGHAFHHEARSGPDDVARLVDDRLSFHGYTLWERAGQPVSLAGVTRQVAGQVRVGPVYTPPGQRGRGYGGAVTWTVSRAARDAGAAQVLLFTDLANPTSNALYQRLGYQPVADRLVLAFSRPGS
ncbi:MAG: GNAT family N-acetyltransferase [Streptosporangiaceae bacterium]